MVERIEVVVSPPHHPRPAERPVPRRSPRKAGMAPRRTAAVDRLRTADPLNELEYTLLAQGPRSWTTDDRPGGHGPPVGPLPVSYTHLRAHETVLDLVCRLLLEKKKQNN